VGEGGAVAAPFGGQAEGFDPTAQSGGLSHSVPLSELECRRPDAHRVPNTSDLGERSP
jgi:hypothetical protein